MKKKKEMMFVIGGILLLITAVIGVSYAAFSYTRRGEKVNTITTGSISMSYTESSNVISITNALPTTDATGKARKAAGEYFDFTVTTNLKGNASINWEIVAKKESDNTFCGENVKFYLTKVNGDSETEVMAPRIYEEEASSNASTGRPSNMMVLATGTESKQGETSTNYRLRLYVNENYNPQGDGGNKVFKVKVNVYGKTEGENNAPNAPELASNMIPVVYDEGNATWIKADTNNNWYNYDEQKWANAVTVSEASRSNYLKASSGTSISMNDINTMWVWIPRYSYTIASHDGTRYYGKQGEYLASAPTKDLPGEIDIKFVGKDTKERGSAKYIEANGISGWYTPDGFSFGDQELNGIWYAKFETSNQEGQYTANNSALTPIVKPKVTSWRAIQVANLETASMGMTKTNNIYGFSSSEVDTHAAKNSERAPVAYLSQSKYGKLGNRSYSGANKEVYMNNYNGVRTGCSSGLPNAAESTACTGDYDNLTDRGNGTGSIGGGASTTGNIYGIYDMNGGAWEYVMGSYNNYSGYSSKNYTVEEAAAMGATDGQAVGIRNSGYTGKTGFDNLTWTGEAWPEAKYYDLYTTNNTSAACNGGPCTGQSLNETANWYGDYPYMVNNQSPWMLLGGAYYNGAGAGVFRVGSGNGSTDLNVSFRLVLCNK